MAVKTARLIVTVNDIATIENCSKRTAAQRMIDIKVYFKKLEKRTKITFFEYAIYLQIPLEYFDAFR